MDLFSQLRPLKLNGLICEDHLRQLLEDVLEEHRFNTLLLHGPSGIGKTTFARIFAEEIGAKGVDFREENCGDKTGVDYAREWIKYIQLPPFWPSSKSKVLILDEAHKLTDANQNALLKGTEDLPPTSYVILCSTEPEKIINTLRSRCGTKIDFTPEDIYSEDLVQGLLALAKEVLGEEQKQDDTYLKENVITPFLDSKTVDTFSIRDFISIVSANVNDISLQNFRPDKDEFTKIKDYFTKGFYNRKYFSPEFYPRITSYILNMNLSPEQCRIKLLAYFLIAFSYLSKDKEENYESKIDYYTELLKMLTLSTFEGPDGRGKFLTNILSFAKTFRTN